MNHFNYKICELRRRPGKLSECLPWVGVQGVVALSLLFAPIFLRRTHVILTCKSIGELKCLGFFVF
ncbi:hypothetical protein FF021_07570 [Leptospira noguchii]|uniref:hypothetical protein n=1 Tax=Leptospira noguchii TaxID=28182 RepID=UPI0011478696|nr:hypothetical protein [Leptospira noguchii]TQE78122.1 hypothetical protein FF021_07570 [Leptospira noguchii]UOG53812.1 hypothetical protein MAL09_06805 [Leptospira noguchii]